jgi:hypothetical protein
MWNELWDDWRASIERQTFQADAKARHEARYGTKERPDCPLEPGVCRRAWLFFERHEALVLHVERYHPMWIGEGRQAELIERRGAYLRAASNALAFAAEEAED